MFLKSLVAQDFILTTKLMPSPHWCQSWLTVLNPATEKEHVREGVSVRNRLHSVPCLSENSSLLSLVPSPMYGSEVGLLNYYRQRSCGKVMFSVVCVCQAACPQGGVPCDHNPWWIGPYGTESLWPWPTPLDIRLHWTGTPPPPVLTAGGYWSTYGRYKLAVRILLECFLVLKSYYIGCVPSAAVGGRGCVSQHALGRESVYPSHHALGRGLSAQGDVCQWCLPRGCLPRGVCPGRCLAGGCLPRGVSATHPLPMNRITVKE